MIDREGVFHHRAWGRVRNTLELYDSHTTTLKTIALVYDVGRAVVQHMHRSDGAKRGWITRRANAARRAAQ